MRWFWLSLCFLGTLRADIFSDRIPWFTESLHDEWEQTFTMGKIVCDADADYQRILIFENAFWGRVLVLDEIVQTVERDEFIYHEMIAHVPLLTHGNVEKVLVIGGADGGTIREVLRHRNVKEVTLVEIDGYVLEMCKKYLPSISNGAFEDPRLRLIVGDGAEFVKETQEGYDIIIIDSTDPYGLGSVLFTPEFYGDCHALLKKGGILITQNGVPFMQDEEFVDSYVERKLHFEDVAFYLATVPTYVGGFMTLGWATDDPSLRSVTVEELYERLQSVDGEMRYYTPELHKAAFCLPKFLDQLIKN